MDTIGFTETLLTKSAVELAEMPAKITQLATLRNALLWTNCGWDGIRVSDLGAADAGLQGTRKSTFLPPGTQVLRGATQTVDVPITGPRVIFPTGERPDQANASIHIAATLSNGTTKIRYFAPIPDGVSIHEPGTMFLDAAKAWSNALATYLAEVKLNWATIGRVGAPTNPIVRVVGVKLQAPSPALFGFQVPLAPPVSLAVGDQVQLRGFRPCRGIPRSLNKTWYVDSVVDDVSPGTMRTVFLRNSTTNLPSDIRVLGTMQKVTTGLVTFTDIHPIRVRTHKRGKPLSVRVGRVKTRIQAAC